MYSIGKFTGGHDGLRPQALSNAQDRKQAGAPMLSDEYLATVPRRRASAQHLDPPQDLLPDGELNVVGRQHELLPRDARSLFEKGAKVGLRPSNVRARFPIMRPRVHGEVSATLYETGAANDLWTRTTAS